MPVYFSYGAKSSEFVSDRYLQINNCGFCVGLDSTKIVRPNGRKDYQLIYVSSGQLEFEHEGKIQLLTGGNVYLFPPDMPQRYRVNGVTTTFYWIHFSGTAAPELLQQLSEGWNKTGELPEFERFCRSFYTACKTSSQPNILYYEGQLISLFATIAEKAGRSALPQNARKIDAALLAINRDISVRLSNDELAKLCGLSRFYFIKLFKSSTGTTPQQYYAQQAIETAKGLLEHTDYTIAAIAPLCGIDDNFYFSRLFKKHTGLSPADYRNALRRGFVDHGKNKAEKVDK